MIPRADIEIDPSLPTDASYWVPKPSDIGDEGFGFFRDVWPIVGAGTKLTASLIEDEKVAVDYVDAHSATGDEFEELSYLLEGINPDFVGDDAPSFVSDPESRWGGLEGLDLGVAGLSYALSNSGFYPTASCRSHQNGQSWSPNPVVIFASDRRRATLLQPLVEAAGCGFGSEHERGELLYVYAPSIREIMDLAHRLFLGRAQFRKLPKTDQKQTQRVRASERSPDRLF